MDKESGGVHAYNWNNVCKTDNNGERKNNLKVNVWEERRWRTEEEEETLKIFGAKKKIRELGLYSNASGCVTLFRCRTNTLKLNWQQRFQGGIVVCPVCDRGSREG